MLDLSNKINPFPPGFEPGPLPFPSKFAPAPTQTTTASGQAPATTSNEVEMKAVDGDGAAIARLGETLPPTAGSN